MAQYSLRSESAHSLRGHSSHSPAGYPRYSAAWPVPRGRWRSGSASRETPSWPASGGRCQSAATHPHSASVRSQVRCTCGCVSTAYREIENILKTAGFILFFLKKIALSPAAIQNFAGR